MDTFVNVKLKAFFMEYIHRDVILRNVLTMIWSKEIQHFAYSCDAIL